MKRGSLPTSDSASAWPVEKTKPTIPWVGGTERPMRSGALLAGGDAEDEPVGILLEQRDRRGLGVEEPRRRVDDALEQALLDVALEAPTDGRTPRRRDKRGDRGIYQALRPCGETT